MTKAAFLALASANLLKDITDDDLQEKGICTGYDSCATYPSLKADKGGPFNVPQMKSCITNSYDDYQEGHKAEFYERALKKQDISIAFDKGCGRCDIDYCSAKVHDFFHLAELQVELCAATNLNHCNVAYLKHYKNANFWALASGCPAVDKVADQRFYQSAAEGPLSPIEDWNDETFADDQHLEATVDWVGGAAAGSRVPEAMRNIRPMGNLWQNVGAAHLSTTQLQYAFCAFHTPTSRRARYHFCKDIAHDERCAHCPWRFVNCEGYISFKDDGAPKRCNGKHACQGSVCGCYSVDGKY